MPEEIRFTTRRDYRSGHPAFVFTEAESIPAGIEGRKALGEVHSDRGMHGRYFIKDLYSLKEGLRQVGNWRTLRNRGARVPSLLKVVTLEDGTSRLLVEDLSVSGRYLVLSMNNREVNGPAYLQLSRRISSATRERLMSEILTSCLASVPARAQSGQAPEVTYDYQANAFMLVINPWDPEDAHVYVADYGLDVAQSQRDPSVALASNLEHAATFYAWMTGEAFRLPADYPEADSLNESFANQAQEILEYRGYV